MLTNSQREHPSAYIVSSASQDELRRLEIQDAMLTWGQGGPLPELVDPGQLRRVLDVGCGTGGWLLETARTYPGIRKLFGADVSSRMLGYADAQAADQHLDDRVQFLPMDALRVLEFSGAFFDLVNQRLGASWIRTWEWTKLLLEYSRVLRPGGIVRITEMHGEILSSSPALSQLGEIALKAFYHSGRLFVPTPDGLTGHLVRLLTQHGFENVQTHIHTLVVRAPHQNAFYENMAIFFRVALPFFQKWTRVPDDYEDLYQQALKEMQEPHFEATWQLLTVCGTAPQNGQQLLIRGLQ